MLKQGSGGAIANTASLAGIGMYVIAPGLTATSAVLVVQAFAARVQNFRERRGRVVDRPGQFDDRVALKSDGDLNIHAVRCGAQRRHPSGMPQIASRVVPFKDIESVTPRTATPESSYHLLTVECS